jgi:NADH-quinone oxidoreductase subunit H
VIVDLAAAALVALLPFGQSVVASTLDVGILFVGSTTALVAATLATRGSIGARLRRALHVAWQHAPGAAAVACVVIATGSLRVQEIARAQSSAPWDWLAFRSPGSPVALCLLLSCARIELGPSDDGWGSAPWLRAALRGHRVIVAGLASVLFLGGWSLPGLALAQQDGRAWLQIAGAAWLMMKTAALVWVMAWSRWAFVPASLPERSRRTALWLIPVGAACFGATAAWDFWALGSGVQGIVSAGLLLVTVLGVSALAHRLLHGLLTKSGPAHLSPFL